MKNLFYTLLMTLMVAFSASAFAQAPPPPNGGNDPGGSNTPVGSTSAPITGGIGILLALGTAYGINKVYQFNKTTMKSNVNFKNLVSMKTIKTLFLAVAILASFSINAQVAVTTDGSSADGSAMLDVKSTDKGFLPPRMTIAQMTAISSPVTGLMVFCTDCGTGSLMVYLNGNWNGFNMTILPTAPTAGTHESTETSITWKWNSVSGATGYKWGTTSDYNAATDMGSSTEKSQTGLTSGTGYTSYVWAYNSLFYSAATTLSAATTSWDVINSITGKTWMNRNLGASQVATSSTDADAYGDLYQWGRLADGHQIRTSETTTTLATSDTPGHGNFIIAPSSPYDWRSPQNDNLWQGVSGTNNPCPSGYRLPTHAEWYAERLSWSSNDAAGAFASPLKLPVAGLRRYYDGTLEWEGSRGFYWSSDVYSARAKYLYFSSDYANGLPDYRAYGFSVRCIKN